MWPSRFSWSKKKGTNIIFLKIHSALTVAPTENLHEYKIVERKMAHLLYMGKVYLALLVWPIRPARWPSRFSRREK